MHHKKHGFTLIEMSIVITIIGLIVGSIFLARNLIHNAELQSVITDVDRYRKAVAGFRDKYNYLPGDLPNAEALWGSDSNCADQTTGANVDIKTATCNGNGDGFIGDATGSSLGETSLVYPTWTNWAESYRAWQHLADSGFIQGSYSGAISSRTATNDIDPGTNVPASKLNNNAIMLLHVIPGSETGVYHIEYNHVLIIGQPKVGGGYKRTPYMPGLLSGDSQSIDQKIDDGKPGWGQVVVYNYNLHTYEPTYTKYCVTETKELLAEYTTEDDVNRCAMIFLLGF